MNSSWLRPRKSLIGKTEVKTLCSPASSRSFGKQIHLQKALVRLLLHLDQIRDRDRCLDLGKVNPLAGQAICRLLHFALPKTERRLHNGT